VHIHATCNPQLGPHQDSALPGRLSTAIRPTPVVYTTVVGGKIQYLILSGVLTAVSQPQIDVTTYELSALLTARSITDIVNAAIRVSSGVVAEDRGADAINADNPIGANAVDALATPTLVPESLCLSSPGDASLAAVLTEGAASADHRTAAPDAAQLVLQTLRGVVNRIGACASNGFIDEWELQSCVGERKERARMTQTLIREGYLSVPCRAFDPTARFETHRSRSFHTSSNLNVR
jgi:hypothetical protein